jgi:hypothetical protein
MVTPALRSHFEKAGVALIPLSVGARMFVEEIEQGGDDTTVVVGGQSGAGPLGAPAEVAARLDIHVAASSHPELADHRIAGVPVVPVVMALEWFLRAARAVRPDLVCTAVRGLKVLRGIKLDAFHGEGNRLTVHARDAAAGHGELNVELRGPHDALHYSATLAMADRSTHAPAPPRAPELPRLEPWTRASLYDGHVLFHGARFQVIRSVEGVSRAGIAGTLVGAVAAGWPRGAWRTDPALLDGGLQLAVLWARHALGGASLPMALREYRTFHDGVVDGEVQCIVHAQRVHDARAVCDVAFVAPSGAVLAEMIGLETVLRPGEAATTSAAAAAST